MIATPPGTSAIFGNPCENTRLTVQNVPAKIAISFRMSRRFIFSDLAFPNDWPDLSSGLSGLPASRFPGPDYREPESLSTGASSSSSTRCAGPSRSSNCPLRTDHQNASPIRNTRATDNGISRNRISMGHQTRKTRKISLHCIDSCAPSPAPAPAQRSVPRENQPMGTFIARQSHGVRHYQQ